jgi:hypothetical protein
MSSTPEPSIPAEASGKLLIASTPPLAKLHPYLPSAKERLRTFATRLKGNAQWMKNFLHGRK